MRDDWVECTLGKICEKAKKVRRNEMPPNKQLKYLDIGGIDNRANVITGHKDYKWKDAPSRAQQIVKNGDVLFSTVRTYLKNIAQITTPEYDNEICSSGFAVLRAKRNVLNQNFLFHYVLSVGFLNELSKFQTGTSYPAVRDKDVLAQPFPLAPLPEQRAIVAKIEGLFSDLDQGIADLKTAQTQLKIYRQAVLKKAFEGIFEFSPLSELADVIGGVTKGRKLEGKQTIELPYLRVANVQDGFLDLRVIKQIKVLPGDLKKYRLEFEDVLFTEGGDRDKLGRGTVWKNEIDDCIHQNHIFRARIKNREQLSPRFLTYYAQSPDGKDFFFKNGKHTTNLASINKRVLSSLPVPVCSLSKQNQIVKEIESRLSVCDEVEETIFQSLEKAEALRQSILKKAFEGRLLSDAERNACKQADDYEPASELLKRIKAEKL